MIGFLVGFNLERFGSDHNPIIRKKLELLLIFFFENLHDAQRILKQVIIVEQTCSMWCEIPVQLMYVSLTLLETRGVVGKWICLLVAVK